MNIFSVVLTIAGLALFEIVSSVDNAIINAEVLHGVGARAKQWFVTWGLFIGVFLVRGMLPWLIIWITSPNLGPVGALTATFSADPKVHQAIEASAPFLLVGGGTFLLFLFFSWLFTEPKNFAITGEKFFFRHSVWFFAVASILLLTIVWFALNQNPMMAFAAVFGSTAYFITHGFKESAAQSESSLTSSDRSDWSKVLYLEVIDATFSIDGVLGAFAFTLSIPLILLGCGIGAVVVRQLTVGNISSIKKYLYLENGAMYSVLILGLVMVLDSFGINIPEWISPIATFLIVGYFYLRSKKALQFAQ